MFNPPNQQQQGGGRGGRGGRGQHQGGNMSGSNSALMGQGQGFSSGQGGANNYGGRGGGGAGNFNNTNFSGAPTAGFSSGSGGGSNNSFTPSNTLRVTISNLKFPVTEDVLRSVFSGVGPVVGIQILNTGDPANAIVTFPDAATAESALNARNGRNIYNDCLTMSICFHHSNTTNNNMGGGFNNANMNNYQQQGNVGAGPYNQGQGGGQFVGQQQQQFGANTHQQFQQPQNMMMNPHQQQQQGFNLPQGMAPPGQQYANNPGNNFNHGGMGGPAVNNGFGGQHNAPMQQYGGGGFNNGPQQMGMNMGMGGGASVGGIPTSIPISVGGAPSVVIGSGPQPFVQGGMGQPNFAGGPHGHQQRGGGRGGYQQGAVNHMGMPPPPFPHQQQMGIGIGIGVGMGGGRGRGGRGRGGANGMNMPMGMVGGPASSMMPFPNYSVGGGANGGIMKGPVNLPNADGVFVSVATYDAAQPLLPLYHLMEAFGGVVSMRRGQAKPAVVTVKVASVADADMLCRMLRRVPIAGGEISCKPFPSYVNKNPPTDEGDASDPKISAFDFTKARHRTPTQRSAYPACDEVVISGCASRAESDIMTYFSEKGYYPVNIVKHEDEGVFNVKFDSVANAVKALSECQFSVCGSEKSNITFALVENEKPKEEEEPQHQHHQQQQQEAVTVSDAANDSTTSDAAQQQNDSTTTDAIVPVEQASDAPNAAAE